MSDASKQFSEQAYLIVLKGGDEENHEDVLLSLGPSLLSSHTKRR